jgi:hypothetical protein
VKLRSTRRITDCAEVSAAINQTRRAEDIAA